MPVREDHIFFYHTDHLGSTSYVTDGEGRITQFVSYMPFGAAFVDEHTTSAQMPFKFNGKELDSETGLYYFGARYYDPTKAIWYGVDPLAELAPDWTPYRFGFNNPVTYVDPTGLFETRAEAREHRREEGIGGRIRKQNDGTYAIHHRGTKGGIRTFNDSEFGVTTAVVFLYSSPIHTQKGGNPIYGSGTYETGATSEHTGQGIDASGLGGRGGAGRFRRPGNLSMAVANLVSKIFGITQETNEPADGISNSTAIVTNSDLTTGHPPNDTSTKGDSVDIRVTKWKQMNPWGGSDRTGRRISVRVHPKDSSEVRKRYQETTHPYGTNLE